jgi:SAM-dependent methyltransferase
VVRPSPVSRPRSFFQYDEAYFKNHFSSKGYVRQVARRNRFIRDLTGKLAGSGRLLEIGFGDDNLVRHFGDGFQIYGIDISEFALKSLPPHYDPTHFRICDLSAQDVPFDEPFDLVLAINIIEHIREPGPALKRIFNTLKPGGILGLHLPTRSNLLSRLQYRFLYNVEEHTFRPSVPALRKLLAGTGFSVESEYAASFLPLRMPVTSEFIIRSMNLYFGIWRRPSS